MTAKEPLSVTHPELAIQANGWDPSAIPATWTKRLEWTCDKGHIYYATANKRTSRGDGCPFCSGNRVLSGFNDLLTINPELAGEADGWDPSSYSKGSHSEQNWKCSKGHRWSAEIKSRVQGNGCPFCSGNRVLSGFNDLLTTNPQLANEADGWDPRTVSKGSRSKRNWICQFGHKWNAVVNARERGNGCPFCAGKKVLAGFNDLASTNPALALEADGWDPTSISGKWAENVSWKCILGHVFVNSVNHRVTRGDGCPICSGRKLQVGFNDLFTTNPDLAREMITGNPQSVSHGSNKEEIWKCALGHEWKALISSRAAGRGCPICAGKEVLAGFNDLASTHPEIAKQSKGWNPTKISKGSHKTVLWECELGHEWKAQVKSRMRGDGCPACSGKQVLAGFNDLQSVNPSVAQMASDWDPKSVTLGSSQKRQWKCGFGHKWQATVVSITSGGGCPVCAGLVVMAGFNDLATTHPEIAKQATGWNPQTFSKGSTKKQNWKCDLGHEWSASPNSRTNKNTNCPYCSGSSVLTGFNDLLTTDAEMAIEAFGWDPKKVSRGSTEKREWRCKENHQWSTSPNTRSGGSGCPTCSKSGFDPNAEGWIYFLKHDRWNLLQIGITNNPDDRLGRHRRLGWKVVDVRGPMDGLIARNWETSLLQMLKRHGAKLGPQEVAGKFDGYTEAWITNSFPSDSLQALIEMVRDEEKQVDGGK